MPITYTQLQQKDKQGDVQFEKVEVSSVEKRSIVTKKDIKHRINELQEKLVLQTNEINEKITRLQGELDEINKIGK